MTSIYAPCPCNSGQKFKFCCNDKSKAENKIKLAQAATQYPLYKCIVQKDWQEFGLAHVIIIRKVDNERYFAAMYLIDTWYLGVKDTYLKTFLSNRDFDQYCIQLSNAPHLFIEFPYEDARSLILGSLAYAMHNGIAPAPDWEFAKYLIEPNRFFENKFEFGHNGKPLYIAGPDDEKLNIAGRFIKSQKKNELA